MGVIRKRDSVPLAAVPAAGALDDEFGRRWPSVLEMLTAVQYPDGSARRTSTITFFVDDSESKVCLNDRDNGLTAWVSASSLILALDSLEVGLADDTTVWRAAGQAVRKGRKRS